MFQKILIADDSKSVREYLTAILNEQTAADIQCCHNGQEVVELIGQGYQPDLCFFDLNMPRMDGVQLLRCLAEIGFSSPIVIISGLSRQVISSIEKLSTEYKLNLLGSIGKPIDATAVTAMLERPSQAPAAAERCDEPIKTYEVLDALKKGSVEPWFQPQVELQRRALTGFEVLCRIRHKRHGLMLPKHFLQTLERSDLIRVVTFELMEKALADIASLPAAYQFFTVSFNISAKLFDSDDFLDQLIALIHRSEVDNSRIIIEITESTLAKVPLKELEGASRLAINGCGLSIDDFGSGRATLDRVLTLPFTEIKIDRQYIPKTPLTEAQRALLESTIMMARRLGMKVVMEGVETFQQWELVQHLGCELAQGFFIAPPMPFDQVQAWVDHWQENT